MAPLHGPQALLERPTMQLRSLLGTLCFLTACAGSSTGPEPGSETPPAPPAAGAEQPAQAAADVPWKAPASIEGLCKASLSRAAATRDQVKSAKGAEADTTLATYNFLMNELDRTGSLVGLIKEVHPDKAVREAAESCERDLQGFITELTLDRAVFDALSGVPANGLDPQAARFQFKVLREFRRSGVDKDEATREKLKKLRAEMVEVGQNFARSIREGTTKIEVDPAELAGLPDDFIKNKKPDDKGKIVLTTDYPDFFPVQTYAKSEAVRKKLVQEFLNRGYPKNQEQLKKLLDLRYEYAKTLGYPTWAEYQAEDKMIASAAAIEKFIADITKIAKPRMDRELKELLARKKKDDKKAKAIEVWDRFYYVDKVREEKFGFDARAARPYFEFSRTLEGMLQLYSELFGIKIERVTGVPVWHDKVHAYEVSEEGQKIGRFYLDMHPREGKYSHAAMFPIATGLAGGQIPEAALVCNFPDPSAGEGPALMEHSDVVTLFHEFGHLIHHILARSSPWVNLSGISTEWDFVEAPSQLLEEWTWDAKVLQRFAKHVETGEPISEDLVKKLRASAEFGKGTHVMRQVFYTAMSYFLHAKDPAKVDLDAFTKDLVKKYSPYPHIEGTHLYAGFGHLEGYSSMYYTYQWSLVLAKDIFTRFEKAGLLDLATAKEYREKILKVGGSKDAKDQVADFLGRSFSLDAYKKWLEKN
jgi:thimet oligopeptidase